MSRSPDHGPWRRRAAAAFCLIIGAGFMVAGFLLPSPSARGSSGWHLPDDPLLHEQWGLFDFGQRVGGRLAGTPGADVRAPEAWQLTTGDPRVVVAVVDSGIALGHPDLRAQVWTNPGESGNGRESNRVDDDHDGYVDDVHGWDFVDGDADVSDVPVPSIGGSQGTPFPHGTAVASVIGARGDDGVGMTGVAQRVTLMPLRAVGGGLDDKAVASAVAYAAAHGARVVNLSLASFVPGFGLPLTAQAMRSAPSVLFVASAGNAGNDADVVRPEPCADGLPNLICVAATDQHDHLARFLDPLSPGTNYGATTVDLAAPGDAMLVARPATDTPWRESFEQPLDGRWTTAGSGVRWQPDRSVAADGPTSLSASWSGPADATLRTAAPLRLGGRASCELHASVRAAMGPADLVTLELSHDGQAYAARVGRLGLGVTGSTQGAFQSFTVPLAAQDTSGPLWVGFHVTGAAAGAAGTVASTAWLDAVSVSCLSSRYGPRDYTYAQGTSFAAPLVSGAAALVLSAHPSLTPEQVKRAILTGVDKVPALAGKVRTGGRLDVYRALTAAGSVASGDGSRAYGTVAVTGTGAAAGEPMPGMSVPTGDLGTPDGRAGATAKDPPWWLKLLTALLRILCWLLGLLLLIPGLAMVGAGELLGKLFDLLKGHKELFTLLSGIGALLMAIGLLVPVTAPVLVPLGGFLASLGLGLSLAANLSKPYSQILTSVGASTAMFGFALQGDPRYQQAGQLMNDSLAQLTKDADTDYQMAASAGVEAATDKVATSLTDASGVAEAYGKDVEKAVETFVGNEMGQVTDAVQEALKKLIQPDGSPGETSESTPSAE